MYPKVLLLAQARDDSVGQAAVANLYRVAIADDLSDIPADSVGNLAGRLRGVLEQGLIVRHDEIDVLDVDEAFSVDPRHIRVHLADHPGGGFDRGLRYVHTYPKAHVAVAVRR